MDRCKAMVSTPGLSFGGEHQCSRQAKRDGYCAQHHPDAKAERDRKGDEKFEARMRPIRLRAAALKAIQAIANGHNDPRALAQKVLADNGKKPE